MTEIISRRNMLGLALAAPVALPVAIAEMAKRPLGGFVPGWSAWSQPLYGESTTESILPLSRGEHSISTIKLEFDRQAFDEFEMRMHDLFRVNLGKGQRDIDARIFHVEPKKDGSVEVTLIEDQMREHDLFEEVEA